MSQALNCLSPAQAQAAWTRLLSGSPADDDAGAFLFQLVQQHAHQWECRDDLHSCLRRSDVSLDIAAAIASQWDLVLAYKRHRSPCSLRYRILLESCGSSPWRTKAQFRCEAAHSPLTFHADLDQLQQLFDQLERIQAHLDTLRS